MKLPSLSLEINRQRKQTLRLIEPVPFWEGESLSLGREPVPWKSLQCAFRDWLPGFVQAGAEARGEGRGDGRLRKPPPSGSNQNFTPRTGGGTNEVACRKPFLGSSDSLNC